MLSRFRGRAERHLTSTSSSSKSKRMNQTEKLKKELVLEQEGIRVQNLFSCVDSSLFFKVEIPGDQEVLCIS